jgi:hypothetical protein
VEFQPPFQIARVVVVEPVHGRTPGLGELGRLLHGGVGGPVQEDNAVGARETGKTPLWSRVTVGNTSTSGTPINRAISRSGSS